MAEIKGFSNEDRYLIFQAISHPKRVKILALLQGNGLSFSSLKHELGMESSGQLQHHLQKLQELITDNDGHYTLTSTGRRALEIFRESEKSDKSIAEICCLPSHSELARDKQINETGVWIRLSIGSILTALTSGIVANFLFPNQIYLKVFDVFGGTSSFALAWVPDAIVFGFFGVSFLVSSISGYPGCEITALANLLFARNKIYCSCLITPYNVPNGRFLQQRHKT